MKTEQPKPLSAKVAAFKRKMMSEKGHVCPQCQHSFKWAKSKLNLCYWCDPAGCQSDDRVKRAKKTFQQTKFPNVRCPYKPGDLVRCVTVPSNLGSEGLVKEGNIYVFVSVAPKVVVSPGTGEFFLSCLDKGGKRCAFNFSDVKKAFRANHNSQIKLKG
jgi:hypothetical protein